MVGQRDWMNGRARGHESGSGHADVAADETSTSSCRAARLRRSPPAGCTGCARTCSCAPRAARSAGGRSCSPRPACGGDRDRPARTVGAGLAEHDLDRGREVPAAAGAQRSFWRALGPRSAATTRNRRASSPRSRSSFPSAWTPGVMSIFAAAQYACTGWSPTSPAGRTCAALASAADRGARVRDPARLHAGEQRPRDRPVLRPVRGVLDLLWIPGTRAGRILSPLVMLSVASTAVLAIVLRAADRRPADRRPVQERRLPGDPLARRGVAADEPDPARRSRARLRTATTARCSCWRTTRPGSCRGRCSASARSAVLAPTTGDSRRRCTSSTRPAHHALIAAPGWWWPGPRRARRSPGSPTRTGPLAVWPRCSAWASSPTRTAHQHARRAAALRRRARDAALYRPGGRSSAAGAAGAESASPARAPARTMLRWLPAAGFAVLLAVAITLNFRVTNGRTNSPPWTSVVTTRTVRVRCAH